MIVPGLFGARSQLPQLTRDYIARRTKRLNQLTAPTRSTSPRRQTIRTTTRSSPTPSTRTTTRTSRTISHSSKSTPTGRTHSKNSRVKTTTRTTSRSRKTQPVRRRQSTVKRVNFKLYRPKAGNLSIEDFKCIFCFKLPEYPKDNGRGIVLCPNCRYPAHADEFKDWLKTSGLCSRCNAPIPLNYRRKPKVISVKNYAIIYKGLLRKR